MKSSGRHRRRWFGWIWGEVAKPGDEKRSKSKLTPPTSAEDLPLVGQVDDELPPTPGSPAMPSLPTSHSPENLPDSEIESLRHVVGLLLPLVRCLTLCVCVWGCAWCACVCVSVSPQILPDFGNCLPRQERW